MATLEDPTQPPHYRPGVDDQTKEIYRKTVLLKDGLTTASIYPITSIDQVPKSLALFLCDELNGEIERGESLALDQMLHIDTFKNYWFGAFAAVMVISTPDNYEEDLSRERQWERECLGTFYIKPNYPGRCGHICTAGFLVNAGIRRKGIGRTLVETFMEWAPKLEYNYAMFNLVFETNTAARRILETMGFSRLGRVRGGAFITAEETVDVFMYGKTLKESVDDGIGDERFEKIKYYLETGKYPVNSDRQEKSRLRSSAAHYRIDEGRLMLKGREVVSDPDRQLQIATEAHQDAHAGINKTTSTITEKYHWTRIKDTVNHVIRTCNECREAQRPTTSKRLKRDYASGPGAPHHPPPQPQPQPQHHANNGPGGANDVVGAAAAAAADTYFGHDQDAANLLPPDLSHLGDALGSQHHAAHAAHHGHEPTQQQNVDPDIDHFEAQNRNQNGAHDHDHQGSHEVNSDDNEIAQALMQANSEALTSNPR